MDDERWERRLRANRAEKDEFFAEDRRSPLSPTARESFDGLDYFDPDPAYRVAATVSVHDDPDPVELTARNGPPERFRRVVTFSFTLPHDPAVDARSTPDASDDPDASGVTDASDANDAGDTGDTGDTDDTGDVSDATETTETTDGVAETLAGYRREGDESLLVPFRDKTTGQETYDGGRYMDLHPDGDLTDGATVTLDFNLAYTPFCAFDDAFVCPLSPEENWLSVAVRAGERDPPV